MVTPGSSDHATPRKIAAGNSAAISPRGDGIAFLRNNQLWPAELSGSDRATLPYQARRLFSLSGTTGGRRSSPRFNASAI
jgi:hypothetical protein